MNSSTKKAIQDRISYLQDNLYRYKMAQMDSREIRDSHEREIAELEADLRNG